MAADILEQAISAGNLILQVLIGLGILVNLATKRGKDLILFIIAVIGYLAILHFVNNFFVATSFICMWFVIMGAKFFVEKEILIGLFILMAIIGPSSPIFYIIAIMLYTISIANFLFTSAKQVNINAKF